MDPRYGFYDSPKPGKDSNYYTMRTTAIVLSSIYLVVMSLITFVGAGYVIASHGRPDSEQFLFMFIGITSLIFGILGVLMQSFTLNALVKEHKTALKVMGIIGLVSVILNLFFSFYTILTGWIVPTLMLILSNRIQNEEENIARQAMFANGQQQPCANQQAPQYIQPQQPYANQQAPQYIQPQQPYANQQAPQYIQPQQPYANQQAPQYFQPQQPYANQQAPQYSQAQQQPQFQPQPVGDPVENALYHTKDKSESGDSIN